MEIDAKYLHERLLTLAKAFHSLCEEHKLTYYMLGGTMLGAIRHNGFIPWDDDMDFGMPRKDYDKFISLMGKMNTSPYEIRFYKNAENSPMHYVKMIDSQTTLIEDPYRDYVEGLYIDVFPLDGVNEKELCEKIRISRILLKQRLITNHCTTAEKKTFIRKVFKKYSQFRNLSKLHSSIEKMMTKRDLDSSYSIANFLGAWGKREIMDKQIMGSPQLYAFEDTFFYGSERADEYLKSLYGDYMQLPPKESQVFRHGYYYLDYNTPYREYMRNNKP